MQENINPYNEASFREQFSKTELYKAIEKDIQILSWKKHYKQFIVPNVQQNLFRLGETPRQSWYRNGVLSLTSFYYINYLLEKNPQSIYDLGCGTNTFKKYIPNIIGIEPDDRFKEVDIYRRVDSKFVEEHQSAFESVMSTCALHFRPFEELRSVVDEFISMVKPGGRGFLAVNAARMLEYSGKKHIKDKPLEHGNEVEREVRLLLSGLECDLIVFDVDMYYIDAGMDGNIRIVFERKA
jgi:hypothetical protein